MSKRDIKSEAWMITVEEAASILGVGQREVQIQFSNGSLTKVRTSSGEVRLARAEVLRAAEQKKPVPVLPGETRSDYIARIVADFPPLTDGQKRVVYGLLCEGKPLPSVPSAFALEERRKLDERAEALKKAQKAALAMTACDVCGVQPDQHVYAERRGIGSHAWTPGRAERLMKRGANA